MKKRQTLMCVHLYDDFSGSANVCSQVLDVLKEHGVAVHVLTGSEGQAGFIRTRHQFSTVPYRLFKSRPLLLLSFLWTQLLLFLKVSAACVAGRADVVYVSTVLPAGAILAGALCGRKVICHVHETGLGSQLLFAALKPIMVKFSDQLICVSKYVSKALMLPHEKISVIPNSLSPAQWSQASLIAEKKQQMPDDEEFVVVMACSLLWYKGIDSFIELARRFKNTPPNIRRPVHFKLLLNTDEVSYALFLQRNDLPTELSVIRRPNSVFDYYAKSSLVLNLSHAEACIETFGLTLLEAMACGVPVVSPLQGGCVELFKDGEGGWRIDSRNIDALAALISQLRADPTSWQRASRRAREAALHFSPYAFKRKLLQTMISSAPGLAAT